jgi:hypothetical protein
VQEWLFREVIKCLILFVVDGQVSVDGRCPPACPRTITAGEGPACPPVGQTYKGTWDVIRRVAQQVNDCVHYHFSFSVDWVCS